MKQVSLQVNGIRRKAQVEDRELLVDLLREKLRLTGTHIGCDTCLLYTSPSPRDRG